MRITHRGVLGTLEAVHPVLPAHGWRRNTACMARVHRTIGPQVAAVGRRVITLCQAAEGVRQPLALDHTYDNGCLPPARLRVPGLQGEPTHGDGAAKRWRPRPPALVAGRTDPVWTWREVLRLRVPPWPQPQTLEAAGTPEDQAAERAKCARLPQRRPLPAPVRPLGGPIAGWGSVA